MDIVQLQDALTEVAELNRLNGIVPEGQEGQVLISAGLLAVAQSIDKLTTSLDNAEYHIKIGGEANE